MSVEYVRVEIVEWADASPHRTIYTVADLDHVLLRLGSATPTDIALTRSDGAHLIAGGQDGRLVVVFSPDTGIKNWHAETGAPIASPNDLVVGGQAADYPATVRLTVDEAAKAIRWFVAEGGMCPDLEWILN